jgi:site-specific recombinase XerD
MSTRRNLTLNDVIEGYLLHVESRRLSPNTIKTYVYAHDKLLAHIPGDTLIQNIDVNDVARCLASYPDLSKKTLCNVHSALSALWRWAVDQGLVDDNPLEHIDRPKPEQRVIVPLKQDEVQALLKSCERTRSYTRPGKRECSNRRPTALRDRAILLLLVDSGIRATELCELTIADVNKRQRHILVFGKGAKERVIPLSPRTIQAIWRYLTTRDHDIRVDEPLFVTTNDNPLDRHQLRHLLDRLASAADVEKVHPHRFRHTFAINYLRNGGDIYSLQRILGHASLDMVKKYLTLAQTDVNRAHRRASPVDNWKL